ncbi:MAG: biosynthetic peptidoglycan transglycosylase, partial [Patescibacteria group bacterium]
MKSSLSTAVSLLFKGLYHIVNFFILIGEITRKLTTIVPILYVVNIIIKFFLAIYRLIIKIKLKPIKLPKVNLPKVKITFNFFTEKIKYFLLGCFITLIIVSIFQSYFFIKELPSPYNIGKVNYPLSTHIYDRNNTLLYEIYREQNRTPVTLKELPVYVAQATIAIEDKDFYQHQGVAVFSGMIRAVKEMVINKNLQGGSTITQQLVKTALLTPERTITRKIKEVILALWTEKIYSKDQILEMYLNQVPYGGSSYGIEEASKT